MGKFLIIKGVDFSQVSVERVTFVNKIQITAKSSNVEYGTVTGSGGYYVGETVTLTAIPSSGCTFKQWNDGNTDATRTIIVGNADAEFIATFIQMEWNEINLSSYTNMYK